jgi:hypothetical protein
MVARSNPCSPTAPPTSTYSTTSRCRARKMTTISSNCTPRFPHERQGTPARMPRLGQLLRAPLVEKHPQPTRIHKRILDHSTRTVAQKKIAAAARSLRNVSTDCNRLRRGALRAVQRFSTTYWVTERRSRTAHSVRHRDLAAAHWHSDRTAFAAGSRPPAQAICRHSGAETGHRSYAAGGESNRH